MSIYIDYRSIDGIDLFLVVTESTKFGTGTSV